MNTFDHSKNAHSVAGATAVLESLFSSRARAGSMLDVGCGVGTWLRAASDLGVAELQGIDGVDVPQELRALPSVGTKVLDLESAWRLGRTYDLVVSVEVAEHLNASKAGLFVECLVEHGSTILFSSAIPGQPGQGHINGQWPEYWQDLFNRLGYVCSDDIRWGLSADPRVEPWYRQNIFLAQRDSTRAGTEPRIARVVHPEMMAIMAQGAQQEVEGQLARGSKPSSWYVRLALDAARSKVRRRLDQVLPSRES